MYRTSDIRARGVDGCVWTESCMVDAQIGTPLVNYISEDIYFNLGNQTEETCATITRWPRLQ